MGLACVFNWLERWLECCYLPHRRSDIRACQAWRQNLAL